VVGSVGYLNARPLTDGLDRDLVTLVTDHPGGIAAKLQAGDVDVALVPVATLLDGGDWRIVPGVCIGADGAVDSVLLVAETPPEAWTEVLLDGESRTSSALSRLLLGEGVLGPTLAGEQVRQVPPGTAMAQARGTTAALVIGDAARQVPAHLVHRIDLAAAWKSWTGLPFVFAVWAGRPDLDSSVVAHLRQVGRSGMATVNEKWSGADRVYLAERIRYDLDDRALMGLRRFAALAKGAGHLASESVSLYGPTHRRLPRVSGVQDRLMAAIDGVVLNFNQALRVEVGADLASLAAAADMKRAQLHPAGDVGFCVAWRSEAGVSPDAAIEAGATRIDLHDGANAQDVAAWVQRWPDVRFVAPASVDLADLPLWVDAGVWGLAPSRAQADSVQWVAWRVVALAARGRGLQVVGTLVIGRGETGADRVTQLLALRQLHADVGLHAVRVVAENEGGQAWASEANTAVDHLRATALTRLLLDVPTLQASPDTEGIGMAQSALRMGCNHWGPCLLNGAPETWPAQIDEVEHQIRDVGFEPVRETRWSPAPAVGQGVARP
jgi:predicted solute-binding protein